MSTSDRRTSDRLDGPTADAFLRLCWGHHNQGRMSEVLWSAYRSRREVERVLSAWLRQHRVPLEVSRLPTTLPGGQPLPPASTPWPRTMSPLPLVDLPVDAVLSLAEVLLWHQLTVGTFHLPTPIAQRLVALSEGQLIRSRAEVLLQHWRHRGGPLACIRAAHPPASPPRIPDADVARFISLCESGSTVAAWGLLLRAGLEPEEARRRLLAYTPTDPFLPTGQPYDPWSVHARIPLPDGDSLSHTVADEVLRLAHQSRRSDALLALQAALPERSLPALRQVLTLLLQLGVSRQRGPDPWAQTASRWLRSCIEDLLLDRPMHWLTLSGMPVIEDHSLPTMAVGLDLRGQPVLFYSPTFVMSLDEEACKGVLCHEIYHVLFGHLRPPAESRDAPLAWTVACEVTVNEYVPYRLPGAPLLLSQFGLPPGESTLIRYQKLRRKGPAFLGRAIQTAHAAGGPGDDLLLRALRPCPRHHRDTVAGQPDTGDGIWVQIARSVGDDLDGPTRAGLARHAGSVAGRAVELVAREPVSALDWRTLLRRQSSHLSRRQSTRRWPNRRAPGKVGVVPGYRRQNRRPVVMVAIDTSASMSSEELGQIAGEVGALLRRGLRVAGVWCDTEIHRAEWIQTPAALSRFPGRGGTDLRPPFAQSVLARFRPDLITYFTDGYGDAPARGPAGVSVLWVLTGASPRVPALYGERVCLRPRDARARVRSP